MDQLPDGRFLPIGNTTVCGVDEGPTNLEAEQALLGAILVNSSAYEKVSGFLRSLHFADPVNAIVFSAIEKRAMAGRRFDAVTLKADLERENTLDQVGGTVYLAQLLSAMVGVLNAAEYGREVFDCWRRRQVVAAARDLIEVVSGGRGQLVDTDKVMADHEARLAVVVDTASGRAKNLGEAIDLALDDADAAARRSGVGGLSTGMKAVDVRINGLEPDTLIVVAGRPGSGKSALAHQWAIEVARAGTPVLEISLEMSAMQLGRRTLAAAAGVPLWKLKRGLILDVGGELLAARKELMTLPITIEDGSGLTGSQIAAKARAAKRRLGIGLLVIDHLHIVKTETDDAKHSPVWAVGRISGAMKRLAKELQIPVLLLAQLNRQLETREDKRPQLSDLRYAGDIEQDADVVAFVHRPEMYLPKKEPDRDPRESPERHHARCQHWEQQTKSQSGRAELIVAKLRDGETGVVDLLFDGPTTTFREIADDVE